jgi:hypothetical protein
MQTSKGKQRVLLVLLGISALREHYPAHLVTLDTMWEHQGNLCVYLVLLAQLPCLLVQLRVRTVTLERLLLLEDLLHVFLVILASSVQMLPLFSALNANQVPSKTRQERIFVTIALLVNPSRWRINLIARHVNLALIKRILGKHRVLPAKWADSQT